jgi:hypothetical protein
MRKRRYLAQVKNDQGCTFAEGFFTRMDVTVKWAKNRGNCSLEVFRHEHGYFELAMLCEIKNNRARERKIFK